jgi:uncharacterized protein
MLGEMNALARFRAQKDSYLRESPDSPLQEGFAGLRYYPENELFAVRAPFEPLPGREVVLLETSTGDEQPYFRAGRAAFVLMERPCALTLYQPTYAPGSDAERGRFFVPFRDATSGHETYGSGRYLEATLLADRHVLLDFNYAYHPFCAYSPRYRCPLPPAENWLGVAVHAGERL